MIRKEIGKGGQNVGMEATERGQRSLEVKEEVRRRQEVRVEKKRKRGRKTASKIWAKKMGVRGKKNNK